MSMLDAASSGLPLIVSDEIGELDRIKGNGFTYKDKMLLHWYRYYLNCLIRV